LLIHRYTFTEPRFVPPASSPKLTKAIVKPSAEIAGPVIGAVAESIVNVLPTCDHVLPYVVLNVDIGGANTNAESTDFVKLELLKFVKLNGVIVPEAPKIVKLVVVVPSL